MRKVSLPDLFVQPRETMCERKVHLEGQIVYDVPKPPPLCESLPFLRPRRVDIGGLELYVEEQGDGIPLVLVHGGPGNPHHAFHPAFTRLDDDVRVIYYDQRGTGRADYLPGPGYTISQAAEDLDALRRALGLGRWAVLGHSYGGFLAQCYAARYPETLTGLALVCSGVPAPVDLERSGYAQCLTPEEREVQDMLFARTDFTQPQLMFNILINGRWKRANYYRPTRETMARISWHEFTFDTGYYDDLIREWPTFDLRGKFDDGRIPTLIVEGRWDQTWSTDKPEKLHSLHPRARMEFFEHSSHMPFNDEPERFFALLEDFLAALPMGS